ncbi:hypothetical protein AB9P05_00340 [Roseivirga sp. BDSF3-8]|uniref:hypothetical protein n=1 Tax=Roseivirga sp. BDSF3-8 TaxID=3241598 RepID=UPI00353181DF
MEANTVINQTDALDFAIAVVVILFVLSIMTEKFTELVRKYPRRIALLVSGVGLLALCRFYYLLYRHYHDTNIFTCKTIAGVPGHNETGWLFPSSLLILLPIILLIGRYFKPQNRSSRAFFHIIISIAIWLLSILFVNQALSYPFIGGALIVLGIVNTRRDKLIIKFKNLSFSLKFFKNIEKGLLTPEKDEKRREITFLSFLLGFIIAYLFHASFFNIIEAVGEGPE